MITKAQAVAANYGAELHYGTCSRTVGPRGGIRESVERWRVNGQCQTWKTRPDHFRLPIKFGLRGYHSITHYNADEWHFAADCPLLAEEVSQ